ncbi:hypothetical protein FIBSPDRAFT_824015 [Athelia psychrophila]|uniref:Golgi apparatus membrane protein TVP38 n=1 Tax=Athelia psychrophila TaxID=1759441 RepID=A0A166LES4_9AGAM|nr:hypothetical protein FIBSPDRAFT_824015 [Fibularhizoctonia sp. CBS 109695]
MATSYQVYGAPPQAQYPPPQNYNASGTTFNPSTTTFNAPMGSDARLVRTPSPTPSEQEELLGNGPNYKKFLNWRFWVRREWLWYYIIGGIILILTVLIAVEDKQIVAWLTPATTWMKKIKFGWLIPVGILFVISFPPLFGHEIVAILCGVAWGLWVGFAIVAAGTFLGELGNFYAFKYCCRARGEKLEKENLQYACLARVVRDGGFPVVLICRLSVLPGHFTTAIFSTCGVGVITFSIAAILSMPKQLITVYIGVILQQSGAGTETSKQKLISDAVLGVTILVTVGAMWYLSRKIRLVKPEVIYARRKARQGKIYNKSPYAGAAGAAESQNSAVFNLNSSGTDIPLNSAEYQQWDSNGRAIGFTGDPRFVHQPEPQRAQPQVLSYREDSGGYENGTTYPKGLTDGRSPVRQESSESGGTPPPPRRDTFEIPRVASPEDAGYDNPFDAPFAPPSGPPPHPFPAAESHLQAPQSYPPYAASQPSVRDSHLPNPFGDDASPYPYPGHAHEATGDSYSANDGHSRVGTDNNNPASALAFHPPSDPSSLR